MKKQPPFALSLRALRRERRLSQIDLAMEAGVSQRHLSFLESGRSKPGRDVAAKLATALQLAPDPANALMALAGYSQIFPVRAMNEPEMAPLRGAAKHVLQGHMPYPAVLVDTVGDILEANPAFDAALSLFGDPTELWTRTHQGKRRNLYRLTLHPEGTAGALLNFNPVVRATLQRVVREAQAASDLKTLLDDILSWDAIDPEWVKPEWGPPPAPIITERYKVGQDTLSVFVVITKLGAAMDAVAGGLRVESYFPADEATQRLLERLEI